MSLARPTLSVLYVLAQFGRALPDQILAGMSGLPPGQLSLDSHLALERKLRRMETDRLVDIDPVYLSSRVLHRPRWIYRLSPAGAEEVARTGSIHVHRTLQAVAHHVGDFGWAEEDSVWRAAFPNYARGADVRARLRKLERRGWIEANTYPEGGRLSLITITEHGLQSLRRDLPRCAPPERFLPRRDQMEHHLLAVSGALMILRHHRANSFRFEIEEALRSEQRRGHQTQAGDDLGALPDAQLTFKDQEGRTRRATMEVLSSKYSSAVIRAKYQGLPPHTIFFVPTKRLADRVEGLGLRRPTILRG